MKKRLLAMLLVLMLVVSLLPVGALADGTAEVIGGTYDGIYTVEYRIEIAQLYKLLLLYGEGVDDDTKLEGATFEFHENRGHGDSQALLPISAVDRANFYYYYSFSDVADAGDPYNISGLIIKYDDKEAYIDASDLRIRYTGDRLYYVEAKNDEKSVVVFYDNGEATTGSRSDYWVYAVRLVDNSETVENWPEDPDTITYSFLNWTYNPDGTGSIFLENAQINGDVEVFARKVSGNDTVAGTQIHIMNDGNALLERFVDLYNTKYKADIQVTDLTESVLSSMKITVHGQNGNATNPNYYVSNVEHNGWEDGYYLVYNRDGDSIDSGSQLYNKHIPANEITKITIEAKIDGNTVNVEVNRGLAPGEFEVSSSGLDRILNIYFNPIPVATVNYTVNYYYDNAIDAGKTETGTGKVGDKIESVTDKSGTGYCLNHSNLPFTLTADEEQNVITVYYATDANDDDIPDSKQVFIKYVSSDADLGTVLPGMQVVTFADGVSSDVVLSSTAAAKSGAEFVYWTDENDFPVSDKGAIDYTLKSPELGKTYTFTANFKTIVEPDAPTADEVNELIDVYVDCITLVSEHDLTFLSLDEEGYNVGDVTLNDFGQYNCDVTVYASYFVGKVSEKYGPHTTNDGDATVTFVYDNGWKLAVGENSLVKFAAECEPIVYTINVEFGKNDPTWSSFEKGSVTSDNAEALTAPTAAAIAAAPEGMEFVGWKYMDMLDDDFVFNFENLSKLIGDNFSDEHEAWVNITAVYEPIVYTINVDFGKNDPTWSSFEKGSVTSDNAEALTAPTAAAIAAAPEGMEFVGWKYMDMLDDDFVFNFENLSELIGDSFSDEHKAWVNITAVYKETPVEPEDAPSLEVTKYDDVAYNESVERGDVVKYTITVENTGNVELTDVVVEDTLWEEGTVIYVNGFRRVLTDDSYTIASLDVGETVTITYYYTVTRADERKGEIVNKVTVKAGDNVTESDTEKTPVDDGWTPKPDDDDTVYVPNWLNTTDHYAYIVGYEDGTIRPQNNITRAEVATIFFRLLTDNARERYWSTTNDFSDIAAESWYNNAISTLSNMGIINGYEDGTFKPNAPITRAEFTAIATRFFDYEAEYDGAFNDVSARAWYADYVQAAVDMGLVDGYPDGGFHPDAYITRAEACTIVNRVLHRVPHEDHLLAESVMNTWPDNPKSAWYYEDMQEATNSHDYDWIREDGETVEDWTKKLPERDWSALETEWATAYSR